MLQGVLACPTISRVLRIQSVKRAPDQQDEFGDTRRFGCVQCVKNKVAS